METKEIEANNNKTILIKKGEIIKNEIRLNPPIDKNNYVEDWINKADFDEISSENDSTVCSSSTYSEDLVNDVKTMNLGADSSSNFDNSNTINTNDSSTTLNKIDLLQHIFNTNNNVQTLGNVLIENSNGVHIGNITYVTGPIHVTQTSGGSIGAVYQNTERPTVETKTYGQPEHKGLIKSTSLGEEEEREEVNSKESFIGNIERSLELNVLRIVDRRTWLAQKPLDDYELMETPVPYVVISHTATESLTSQADNIYLVRNIQCFHIESRRWNDIAYSFLIGCDGNVYEGRGWQAVGAHTYGYNKKSIGISFIGCFMRELPPPASISACKLLIKRGIELGYLRSDYKLIAHCQCSATESPGRMLYEELETWANFTTQLT